MTEWRNGSNIGVWVGRFVVGVFIVLAATAMIGLWQKGEATRLELKADLIQVETTARTERVRVENNAKDDRVRAFGQLQAALDKLSEKVDRLLELRLEEIKQDR